MMVAAALRAPATSRSAWPWLVVLVGFLVMYVPSWWQASDRLWRSEEFGHGPIILAITAWLLWQRREALVASLAHPVQEASRAALWAGGAMFALGALLYVAGRALSIASVEFVSQWLVLGAALIVVGGTQALRAAWFPWVYLIFMIPLPATLVDAMTGPLKHSISVIVVDALYAFGYPIARSGVMISVGPYQLLVADACSGLNSMFSLAALGTLFIHMVAAQRKPAHVALLLASIVPIAFIANAIRVVILVLVTYHVGDEAGQGFLHGAAGIVLMVVALAIFVALDRALAFAFGRVKAQSAQRA